MYIYRSVLIIIICLWYIQIVFAGSRKPDDYTPHQLEMAEDTLLIQNVKIVLNTYLWRDFMPQSPPDGKPLRAVMTVVPVNDKFIPDKMDADKFWVIHNQELWAGSLKSVGEHLPLENRTKLEKTAKGGPKWGPGISVTVVIQIIDPQGKLYLLKASDQLIHRTD